MRNIVNALFVPVSLMLLISIVPGCSKKSQQPSKAADKGQSQYSTAKTASMVQAQYSVSREARKLPLKASDEEIIKAIDDSGALKREDGSFVVVPPVKIVERGKRNRDGSWPIRAKFTIKVKMKDGKVSQPTETTSLFTISEEKDATGKSVLKAKLGS